MKTTVNVRWNKGCIAYGHNQRDEKICENEKHIDLHNKHGHSTYEQLYQKDLKSVYEDVFGSAIADFNARNKPSLHKSIDGIMQAVINDNRGYKQRKLVNGKKVIDEDASRSGRQLEYEFTVKVSNTERERDKNGRSIYDDTGHLVRKEYFPKELQRACLIEYYETFQENNPYFRMSFCYYHGDEGFYNNHDVWEYSLDHLHVGIVPFSDDYTKGLKVRNSMNRALNKMGCKTYDDWAKKEQERLGTIVERQYKAYCEANPSFTQENGKTLEIYHPIRDGLRKGDMDKEQYIKEQELRELQGELASRSDEVQQREQETDALLVVYQQRKDTLGHKQDDLDYQLEEVNDMRMKCQTWQKSLNEREKQLNEREKALASQEKALEHEQEEHYDTFIMYQTWEHDLEEREKKLEAEKAAYKRIVRGSVKAELTKELTEQANKQVVEFCDKFKDEINKQYRRSGRPLPKGLNEFVKQEQDTFQLNL